LVVVEVAQCLSPPSLDRAFNHVRLKAAAVEEGGRATAQTAAAAAAVAALQQIGRAVQHPVLSTTARLLLQKEGEGWQSESREAAR